MGCPQVTAKYKKKKKTNEKFQLLQFREKHVYPVCHRQVLYNVTLNTDLQTNNRPGFLMSRFACLPLVFRIQ